jgi:multiple sugar transport system substrate-binding protein
MAYDASTLTLSLDRDDLAWTPGPAGPGGALDTSLWVWSLAISSRSRHKGAAWQWLQWATGHDHLLGAALHDGHHDPVRASVARHAAYRQLLSGRSGYLDTLAAVSGSVRVLSTPQQHYFDTSARWAGAVRDIYRGETADTRLAALDRALAARF